MLRTSYESSRLTLYWQSTAGPAQPQPPRRPQHEPHSAAFAAVSMLARLRRLRASRQGGGSVRVAPDAIDAGASGGGDEAPSGRLAVFSRLAVWTQWDAPDAFNADGVRAGDESLVLAEKAPLGPSTDADGGGGGVRVRVLSLGPTPQVRAGEIIAGAMRRWWRRRHATAGGKSPRRRHIRLAPVLHKTRHAAMLLPRGVRPHDAEEPPFDPIPSPTSPPQAQRSPPPGSIGTTSPSKPPSWLPPAFHGRIRCSTSGRAHHTAPR